MKKFKILTAGGGTASHVYPTLEVLDLLGKRRKVEVEYIGGIDSIEQKIVGKKYKYHPISVGKLNRFITLSNIVEAVKTTRGYFQAVRIIKKFQPDLIFTKGAYVTFPAILAASRCKIPIVAHESDSIMGLSNKLALKLGAKICVGFPKKLYPKSIRSKIEFTGIPIRRSFTKDVTTKDRQTFNIKRNIPVILITGGSQGALAINEAVKPLLPFILGRAQIIHLTGEKHIKDFLNLKNKLNKEVKNNYHPFGFLYKGMESAVKISDIIISRGGSSLSEFAASGKPTIIIPLPNSANDHQLQNAQYYSREGAAVTIRQNHLNCERLRDTLDTLLDDPERLTEMSKNAKKLSVPDATDKVVRVIEEQLKC